MSGLLPHAIEHAVRARTVDGGSQSFGAVVVTLLILLLLEWEGLRLLRRRPGHWLLITVISVPLLVVMILTAVARLAPFAT